MGNTLDTQHISTMNNRKDKKTTGQGQSQTDGWAGLQRWRTGSDRWKRQVPHLIQNQFVETADMNWSCHLNVLVHLDYTCQSMHSFLHVYLMQHQDSLCS